MQIFSLPDHSDFQKSRTALMSASMVLLILVNMTIVGKTNIIDFFGLKILFSQKKLIIFWGCVNLYLIAIYCMRARRDYFALKYNNESNDLNEDLSDINKKMKDVIDRKALTTNQHTMLKELSGNQENTVTKLYNKKGKEQTDIKQTRILIDYSPPFALWGFAMISAVCNFRVFDLF